MLVEGSLHVAKLLVAGKPHVTRLLVEDKPHVAKLFAACVSLSRGGGRGAVGDLFACSMW